MNTPTRLGVYGAGLAVAFAAAFGVAAVAVPDDASQEWTRSVEEEAAGHGHDDSADEAVEVGGLAVEQDGYLLEAVTAPHHVGDEGPLTFRITGPDGEALTEYAVSHEKRLHLIVVRSDGAHFRHVHPEFADGAWSIPWTWEAAGTYRVYADFVPGDTEDTADVTLSRSFEVEGDFGPEIPSGPSNTATVDGFEVTLRGDLAAGTATELTVEITRDGEPVTALEPYLGAFGHLVALRQGDLAYLHVHPEGDEPTEGETSGPTISFATEAPTEGRYLLYLDFQVDGEVRTAAFVVDTADGAPAHGGDGHDD